VPVEYGQLRVGLEHQPAGREGVYPEPARCRQAGNPGDRRVEVGDVLEDVL
jgi:hypothetical protein